MDLDHPAQRLATILADVGASTIITSTALSVSVNAKVKPRNTGIDDCCCGLFVDESHDSPCLDAFLLEQNGQLRSTT